MHIPKKFADRTERYTKNKLDNISTAVQKFRYAVCQINMFKPSGMTKDHLFSMRIANHLVK